MILPAVNSTVIRGYLPRCNHRVVNKIYAYYLCRVPTIELVVLDLTHLSRYPMHVKPR